MARLCTVLAQCFSDPDSVGPRESDFLFKFAGEEEEKAHEGINRESEVLITAKLKLFAQQANSGQVRTGLG